MKFFLLLATWLLSCAGVTAQNVGIGTATPNNSALLELSSNSKGILVPRMQTSERIGIINPARGLLVFDTDTNEFWMFGGSSWFIVTQRRPIAGIANTGYLGSDFYYNTGNYNTAYGVGALSNNSGGNSSTAMGYLALGDNYGIGSFNTAVGYRALRFNQTAQYNTAIGYNAGSGGNNSFEYGYNNVFVGANTEANMNGCYNVIAIGNSTLATTNVARFGNSATTSYGGWASWTTFSDGRFKTNVQENVSGLSFINRLKPVTYKLAAKALNEFYRKNFKDSMSETALHYFNLALQEKEQITYTGFLAQEVEAAANASGFNFSGVDKPKTDHDTYGLRYAEFTVPLVKAVQELSKINEELNNKVTALEARLAKLEILLNK